MNRLLLMFASVIAVSSAVAEDRPVDLSQGFLPHFACKGGSYGLRLAKTYKAVSQLASLKREYLDLVGREPGYTATRKDLEFRGLSLGVVIPSNKPNSYLISGAEITGAQWKALIPFYVGESIESVRHKLDSEGSRDPQLRMAYGTESSTVAFRTSARRVVAIIYSCFTG